MAEMQARVFNPYNEAGISANQKIRRAPESVQMRAFDMIEDFLGRPLSGDEARQMFDLTLIEAEPYLDGIEKVNELLDSWAIEASFDPDNVAVETAFWIVRDDDDRQVVVEAQMFYDESSPNGFAWYIEGYEWTEDFYGQNGHWEQENLGAYWGFDNAYELESEWDAFGSIDWERADQVRITPEFAHVLGIDGNRQARKAWVGIYSGLDSELKELTPQGERQFREIVQSFGGYEEPISNIPELESNVRKISDIYMSMWIDKDMANDIEGPEIAKYLEHDFGGYGYIFEEFGIDQVKVYTTVHAARQMHDKWKAGELSLQCEQLEELLSASLSVPYQEDHWLDEIREMAEIDWERADEIAAETPSTVKAPNEVCGQPSRKEEKSKTVDSTPRALTPPGADNPAKYEKTTVGKDASDMRANRKAGHEVGVKKQGRGL